ncbi:MAG: 50S ribosomal protein L6, partial [Gammaproteobacteria bacterium]|nr:50S ribosomal protein L6 [Gammaproteobacteria bacterium]
MSRIANKPVEIPSGAEISVSGQTITCKGSKGTMSLDVVMGVNFKHEDNAIVFTSEAHNIPITGTMRSLTQNIVTGVTEGFEKKLILVGVGYRAQMKGSELVLSLGFSHPINYPAPEGITIAAPSQTEIVVTGCDKQKVGQVCAEIRAYRPPEPYKGK